MSITEEEAKLIIEAFQQCRDVNGFMDDDVRKLYDKIKQDFNLFYYKREE